MTAADRLRRLAVAAPTLGPDGAWLASALRRYLAHWSLSTPWRAATPTSFVGPSGPIYGGVASSCEVTLATGSEK